MKRTQLKDALRNIRKQVVSYLSIVVIAALGVTMFLGIDYSASAIRKIGSAFYNEQQYRDIELTSTLLLSEQDLSAIREINGVKDAEGVFVTSAKVAANDVKQDVQAVSLTERINSVVLYDGRLPIDDGECAVEQQLMDRLGWRIGDSIELCNSKGEATQFLKHKTFTVCGVVLHPDHVCGNVPQTPYVLVTKDAFDTELLDGCCMKAVILTEREAAPARYGSAYLDGVDKVHEQIKTLAGTRTVIREAEAKETIAKNRDKLDDGKQKLEDARAELDKGYEQYEEALQKYRDGEEKLKDGRAELDDAEKKLREGEEKLKQGRAELDDAKKQLDAGKAELDAGKPKLDAGRKKLISGWNQLEDIKETIRGKMRSAIEQAIGESSDGLIHWASKLPARPDHRNPKADDFPITANFTFKIGSSLQSKINAFLNSADISDKVLRKVFDHLGGEGEYSPEAARRLLSAKLASISGEYGEKYDQLAAACEKWDKGHKTYLNGLAKYNEGLRQYEEGLAKYNDGEAQYAEGLREYEEALQKYKDGTARYEQGVKELENAKQQLEDGRKKLEDGEAQYADGLKRYAEGTEKIDAAEKLFESLGACKWISVDTYGNGSFVQLGTAGSNLKSMEMTFSLLFVLVGALVIYATISKMIDEQRTLVGTTKALGFFNREIFLKYLLFGITATLVGALIGTIFAGTWVQHFILNGYNRYFNINLVKPTLVLLPTLIVFVTAAALAVAAIWIACRKLLKQPAIQLMQQSVPKGSKKGSGAKTGLPLYSRLILRNIKTDWKRVLVTIVSVAGCCSLVIIGFTLRRAVQNAEYKQFDEIIQYDGLVRMDPDADENTVNGVEQILTEAGTDITPVYYSYITVNIRKPDIQELYCGDLAGIERMLALNDVGTGKTVVPTDEGILVAKRFSEIYGLKVGDTFEIALNGTQTANVRVAAIFDNYVGRAMYMDNGCFNKLFGKDAGVNACMIKLNGADADTLLASLRTVKGYESYREARDAKPLFDAATSVMNAIVLLFILMAAVMAGVVLMNLTNIYIMQKKRELTVMRINGFTVKEVIGYVLRETVITTLLGILLGIAIGSGIGYKIVRSLEQSFVQFDRSVAVSAWAIGAAMTVLFTVIVNIIALRKVKNLKLTDVA